MAEVDRRNLVLSKPKQRRRAAVPINGNHSLAIGVALQDTSESWLTGPGRTYITAVAGQNRISLLYSLLQ